MLFMATWSIGGSAASYELMAPETFEREMGSPVVKVINFTASDTASRYRINVYNGGLINYGVTGDRVTSAVITLNGKRIFSPWQFKRRIGLLSKSIKVQDLNNLEVEVRGKKGGLLIVEIIGEDDEPPIEEEQGYHLLEPLSFARHQGSAVKEFINFSAVDTSLPYTVNVYNGGAEQFGITGDRVTAAVITLNGKRIFSPNQFNENAVLLSTSITAKQLNELTVKVRGQQGGVLVLEIVGQGDQPPVDDTGVYQLLPPLKFEKQQGSSRREYINFTAVDTVSPYSINVYNGGLADYGLTGERVKSAVVRLNGQTIFSANKFNENVALLSDLVSLQELNELSVEVRGKKGGVVVVEITGEGEEPIVVSNGNYQLLEPRLFERQTGSPVTETVDFSALNTTLPYTINIYNGGLEDYGVTGQRVTSAKITLNGERIFRPNQFRKNVGFLTKTINLQDLNQLEVELRGQPGGILLIEVIGQDGFAPTIVATVTPPANANGWYQSDAEISYQCADSESGVASCPDPVTVTNEGANQTITASIVDLAGNQASVDTILNIDKTSPTISALSSPPVNPQGWLNAPVTVSFDCQDTLSGVADCTAPIVISVEGENQSANGTVTDLAGNTATINHITDIDQTAPLIAIQLSSAANAAGWHSAPVTATFICNDTLSGVLQCPAPQVINQEGANQIISGIAIDNAGNQASASVTINLDISNPLLEIQTDSAANSLGWYRAPVNVNFNCQDVLSGVGTCSNAILVNVDGANQVVTGTAFDLAGNTTENSLTINLDQTPPTITAQLSMAANAQGWHNQELTIDYVCTDSLSGIQVCGESRTISSEGANQIISADAIDNADNITTNTQTINVDITAPSIAFITPINAARFLDRRPTIQLQVSDNISLTNDSLSLTVNGQPFDGNCTIENDIASCVLNSDLPTGAIVLLASIRDVASNQSNTQIDFFIQSDGDGDGVADELDAFPADPTESSDIDSDGIGDNSDPDRDGDGFSNDIEEQVGSDPNSNSNSPPDLDGDFIPDVLDDDLDGDGIDNDVETQVGTDPADATSVPPDLDADGIPDSIDDDRDGDGFPNDVETSSGSNPDDAQDYPDTIAPGITLDLTSPVQVNAEFITVTGTVAEPVQPNSGIASVRAISSSFPNTSFPALLSGNTFSVDVPLTSGSNTLQFQVSDLTGNSSSANLVVERRSPPGFFNLTPVDGTLITEDTVTIAGNVRAFLPLEQLQFFVNEYQITPSGTQEASVYSFSLPNIPLQLGSNIFVLRAINPDGTTQATLDIIYSPENPEQISPPKITLLSPVDGAQLNVDSFRAAFQVESFAGPLSITLNGSPISLPAPEQKFQQFSEIVSFPDGQDQVTVTLRAVDSLQKSTTFSASFSRDQSFPSIVIDNSLQISPVVNDISVSNYTFSGLITDSNLGAVLINGQSVSLVPDTNPNTYRFSIDIPVPPGQTQTIDIYAADLSGNVLNAAYIVQNTAVLEIQPVLPPNNTDYLSTGTVVDVQVVARVSELLNGETVQVRVDTGPAQSLSLAGTLATGTVQLPETSGDYAIYFDVLNNLGELLTSAERTVSVINQNDIAVELIRIEPENNSRFIEPNKAIELYFNREVDLSLLQVSVKETLNGNTYINDDPLGLDFINSTGYQLKEVNRNLEDVPGSLSVVPGGQGLAFYPTRQFGFNAELFVEVVYNGVTLERSTFRVRELPTYLFGNVRDQFGQPLENITVSMPGISRTTVTNGDGGFAFGFQESGENIIPGGRQRLEVNPGIKNPKFGSQSISVNLQRNRKNTVANIALTEMIKSIPFQNVSSGQVLSLAQGDLVIDLNAHNARLLFAQGRASGAIHSQFLPFEHIGTRMSPAAIPHWVFGNQPKGVRVEGDVGLSFKVPKLSGSYDYLDDIFKYAVIVGFNPILEVIEPIGIGRINNFRVESIGAIPLQSLDFIGYALVDPANNPLLEAVINGEKTLQQLKAELQ